MTAHAYLAVGGEFRPDRFYAYDDLSRFLQAWAEAHPTLATLSTLGETHEGRAIWCMALTNAATGPAETKPGYWIDANVHAGEVTGSAVALYTIRALLDGHGRDARITRLLDEMVFYVAPRVAADGAERYLTTPESLRSSTRLYPEPEAPRGFQREDLNGDGAITLMRLPHPQGAWKVSAQDPRLMVRRGPDETAGTFYWLLPEGRLDDYEPSRDGCFGAIASAKSPYGLDFNRNFPAHWAPEAASGSGPFPLSEPETRALAGAIAGRKNLTGSQHYHTFSAVILRPSTARPDSALDPQDLARFKALGAIGEEETGYPCISIHEDFLTDKQKPYGGLMLDWVYDHQGLFAFSSELWSLGARAGCAAAADPIGFYFGPKRSESDDLAMLRWIDKELDGFGFEPWTPYDHPQFGPVEIGGWRTKEVVQNVPGPFLLEECERNFRFTLRAAACAPCLRVSELHARPLGDGCFKLRALVENTGFLPTNVSERAVALKTLRADRVRLTLGAGAELLAGETECEIGYLPGRSGQYEPLAVFPAYGIPNRRVVEWVVRAPAGCELGVEAISQRAGRDVRTVRLGEPD